MKPVLFALLLAGILLLGCAQSGNQPPAGGGPGAPGGLPTGPNGLNAPPDQGDIRLNNPRATPGWQGPNPDLKGIQSCDSIASPQDREACFVQYAAEHLDAQWCYNVWEMYNDCYGAVAYAKKDATLCESILNNQDQKDMCYLGVADQTNDLSLCARMQTPSIKRQCESDNAVQQPVLDEPAAPPANTEINDAYCASRPTADSERDLCYFGLSYSKPMLATCEKITDQGTREGCYLGVAVAIKDETICAKITTERDNGYAQSACYFDTAQAKHDPSICALAPTTPDAIQTCMAFVEPA
ncbi:MAG: hypothetical protein Q7R47_04740 [Candidatus Diapherotrites archaeon]|nr:hypothetical protein [Candidatus Diapherotrites archaeon]